VKIGVRFAAVAGAPIGVDKFAVAKRVMVVCVIGKLNDIEGVLSTYVKVNGDDSAPSIIKMIGKSRFGSQVKAVALNGIAIAGLNVVDYKTMYDHGLHTIVITRNKPRPSKLIYALNMFARKNSIDVKHRIKIIKDFAVNKPEKLNGFYVQSSINREEIKGMASYLVSALRLAHLIASGVASGESKGRI